MFSLDTYTEYMLCELIVLYQTKLKQRSPLVFCINTFHSPKKCCAGINYAFYSVLFHYAINFKEQFLSTGSRATLHRYRIGLSTNLIESIYSPDWQENFEGVEL